MKKTLIVIVFILLNLYYLVAQNTFEKTISLPTQDVSKCIIETKEGNFILLGIKSNNYFEGTEFSGYILELNKKGETLREKDIIIEDSLVLFFDMIEKEKDGYYLLGSIGSNDSLHCNLITYIELDSDFIIKKKINFNLPPNSYISTATFFENSNNNFIIYGAIRSTLDSPPGNLPFLFEITKTGELVNSNFFEGLLVNSNIDESFIASGRIFDIIEKKDNSGYFAVSRYYPEYNNGLRGKVYNFSKELKFMSYISIPEQIQNVGTLKWYSDTTYIVSGAKIQDYDVIFDEDIGLAILDTLGNTIKIKYIGKADTTDFPAYYSNFDYTVDSSAFYIAGTENFIYNYFPRTQSKIILTKVDKELNVIWEKFYGGDAYYIAYFIKSTSDGGCIIISARYDYQTQANENDIHILKVNSEGELLTSIENPEIKTSEMLVFPNPGTTELKIRTAVQRLGGEFYLYDISGKLVLKNQISDTETNFNTYNLKSGTYIYKYYFDGRWVENGKWLKN